MITQFNDDEDRLLQSMPLRAQIIYLRGLRRFMNYQTGIVGGPERRISLKMLSEISESINNRKLDQPGKKEVIVSLDQLKKVGLIERIEDVDFLIFFLPKATAHQSVQNNHGTTTAQQRHNNGTDSGTNSGTERSNNNNELLTDNGTDNDIPKNHELFRHTVTTAHIRLTDKQITNSNFKYVPKTKKTSGYGDEFETMWNLYPQRNGGNPKAKAFSAWNARLREGATVEQMIEGVNRYRLWCDATQKTGTELVKHAATFLGPECAFLDTWIPPVVAHSSADTRLTKVGQHNLNVSKAFLEKKLREMENAK